MVRFADIVVDLASLASAARSVMGKHVALRRGQMDWSARTSSVASDLAASQRKLDREQELRSSTAEQGAWDGSKAGRQRDDAHAGGGASGETEAARRERGAASSRVGNRQLGVPVQTTWAPSGTATSMKTDILVDGPSVPGEIDAKELFRTARGPRIMEGLGDVVDESKVAVDRETTREEQRMQGTATVESGKIPKAASRRSAQSASSPSRLASLDGDKTDNPLHRRAHELRESKVPSSRIGRIWNYGGLAAGMFAGAMSASISRALGGGEGPVMLSAGNMERLVARLSRMRGAALKLGQMLSFQDSKMLPAPILDVLQRVQDRADYMPAWQRDRVLVTNLGRDWRNLFDEFEDKPMAAASIGQVHRATLRCSGARVAVKIQYPGVADSINSDLDNLSVLLAATKLLPRGLYLDKTIANARTELAWECDYEREAGCARHYRNLLAQNDDDRAVFAVPRIYPEACGRQVLTMELMSGAGVTRVSSLTQDQRDWIGSHMMRLCLREIASFQFMQTDPNWTNFLFNARTCKLELLDFGAARAFPDRFVDLYVAVLEAASRSDRSAVQAISEQLGFLNGHETSAMLDAHLASVLTLAEPFMASAPPIYDFRDQTITDRVKAQIPIIIRERLAPPPEETYSLHRKLSGAFLLCARLGSRVPCRDLFERALEKRRKDAGFVTRDGERK